MENPLGTTRDVDTRPDQRALLIAGVAVILGSTEAGSTFQAVATIAEFF
jgi:hypothetical protein